MMSLPAWGVWIEIHISHNRKKQLESRSPHGECGLKSRNRGNVQKILSSLPAWGVWIEMRNTVGELSGLRSLPAWGVWIEMFITSEKKLMENVAPRMGSVD